MAVSSAAELESVGPQLGPPSCSRLTQDTGWADGALKKYTDSLTSLGLNFPISTMEEKLLNILSRMLARLYLVCPD